MDQSISNKYLEIFEPEMFRIYLKRIKIYILKKVNFDQLEEKHTKLLDGETGYLKYVCQFSQINW